MLEYGSDSRGFESALSWLQEDEGDGCDACFSGGIPKERALRALLARTPHWLLAPQGFYSAALLHQYRPMF